MKHLPTPCCSPPASAMVSKSIGSPFSLDTKERSYGIDKNLWTDHLACRCGRLYAAGNVSHGTPPASTGPRCYSRGAASPVAEEAAGSQPACSACTAPSPDTSRLPGVWAAGSSRGSLLWGLWPSTRERGLWQANQRVSLVNRHPSGHQTVKGFLVLSRQQEEGCLLLRRQVALVDPPAYPIKAGARGLGGPVPAAVSG